MFVKALLGEKGGETYTVSPHDTVLTALELFKAKRIGFAVVIDQDGNPVGGISERDVCKALASAASIGRQASVRDVMMRDIEQVSPADNLVKVLDTMTRTRSRHLLVMDDARLLGVISIGDVVKHRLDEVLKEETELLKYVGGAGYS